MKGVLLLGGSGARLRPATRSVNKHLLPVYDKPMFYHPLATLLGAGVDELTVVTNPEHVEAFARALEFLTPHVATRVVPQARPGGIPHALLVAAEAGGWDEEEPTWVALGDNIAADDALRSACEFLDRARALVYLTPVADVSRYGAWRPRDQPRIVEKPARTPGVDPAGLAVTGFYRLPPQAATEAAKLAPSLRGELEIADLLMRCQPWASVLAEGAWWDAGEPDSLWEASSAVRAWQARTGLLWGSPHLQLARRWLNAALPRGGAPAAQSLRDWADEVAECSKAWLADGSAYAERLAVALRRLTTEAGVAGGKP